MTNPNKIFEYIQGYVVGLVEVIFNDYIMSSLALGAFFVARRTDKEIGLASFFFTYVMVRTVNSIANAIGMTGQHVVNEMRFQARFMTDQAVPPITPPATETPST